MTETNSKIYSNQNIDCEIATSSTIKFNHSSKLDQKHNLNEINKELKFKRRKSNEEKIEEETTNNRFSILDILNTSTKNNNKSVK